MVRLQLPSVVVTLLPLILFATLVSAIPSFSSAGAMTFCKCLCFSNSTILPLYLPKDPLHPCLTCTRQFCLDQKLPACLNAKSGDEDLDTGTGEGGDVEARCFRQSTRLVCVGPWCGQADHGECTERDSPKSHVLVLLFIIVTGGLLFGAGLKQYGVDLQAMFARGGLRGIVSVSGFCCFSGRDAGGMA
jgi:hypothetical protein